MTRIIEISGIPGCSVRNDAKTEMAQRAKLVKERSLVDTVNLSSGEMLLNIRVQRAKMLMEYYEGTPLGDRAKKEFEYGRDVLFKGLHTGFKAFTGLFENEVSGVLSAVRRGYSLTSPASGFFTWREKKMRGERNPNRGIGDPIVPIRDCESEYPNLSSLNLAQGNVSSNDIARITALFPGISSVDIATGQLNIQQVQEIIQTFQIKRLACVEENKYRKIFNEHLEKTSHHALYLHMLTGQANNAPNKVAIKEADHNQMIGWFANDSKISKSLLKEWMVNGVMRSNVKENGEPWTPLQSIEIMKENADIHKHGIGDFGLTAAIIIVAALGAALANAQILRDVINGDQSVFQGFKEAFNNVIDVIGTTDFGADAPDWVKTIQDDTGGGNSGGPGSSDECPAGFIKDENGNCVPIFNQPGISVNSDLLVAGGLGLLGLITINNNK